MRSSSVGPVCAKKGVRDAHTGTSPPPLGSLQGVPSALDLPLCPLHSPLGQTTRWPLHPRFLI